MEKIEIVADIFIEKGAVILEPQSIYNHGIIGYEIETNRLIYSLEKLHDALISIGEMSSDDALDWLYYNTLGTNFDGYPIIKNDTWDSHETV